jgi:Fic family protein
VDASIFTSSSPGRLVPAIEGQSAFVPDPLPPDLQIDHEAAVLLEAATIALGELRGVSEFIQNPNLISRPLVTREAIYSSRIEGTYASAEEVALAAAGSPSIPQSSDTREVWNYLSAVNVGMRRVENSPVNLDLVRDLHRHLMGDLFSRDRMVVPGEFRTVQNWIGASGATPIAQARFVPPPAQQMAESLEKFESYLSSSSSLPALIRLALVHYQFEAIHPFIDGNGRIGRMLVTLLLARWGLLKQPMLHLSTFFDKERAQYVGLLLKVSTDGAWAEWVKFFLRGIAEQSREACRRARKLWQLREDYYTRVRMPQASGLLPVLVDTLFEYQVITIPQAARALKITYPSAQQNIRRLVEAGILHEISGAGPRNSKLFLASEILRVAEDPDSI